jgi:hypothetical protein
MLGTGLSVRKYTKEGDSQVEQVQNGIALGVLIAVGLIIVLAIVGLLSQP